MENKGKIIAVSSPSGGGKTSVVKKLLKDFQDIVFSISVTTRPKRSNEVNGVDYFLLAMKSLSKELKMMSLSNGKDFMITITAR